MARVDPEQWDDKSVELVYVAGSVDEAGRVEVALNDAGIDFTIGPEEFVQGLFSFVFAKSGAGFFVVEGQAAYSRTILRNAGLTRGVID